MKDEKVVNLSDHPKLKSRAKHTAEIEWLKRYHRAHEGARELSDKEFDLLHAGMHWLLRAKIAKSLAEAYKKSLLGLDS